MKKLFLVLIIITNILSAIEMKSIFNEIKETKVNISENIKEKKEVIPNTKVEKIGNGGAKTKLRVELEEGKNRHIRRLFGALKDPKFGTPLKVLELNRISIGSFKPNIEIGKWRYLSIDEEKMLIKRAIKVV